MIKVSVIIPVYNGSAFLDSCMKALMAQTETQCEFIFINDGSTDNTQEIISRYQETDSRIVLINQPNAGVSMARNAGIAMAKGAYLGFFDVDDAIEKDMFEKLYQNTNHGQHDIVFSNFYADQGKNTTLIRYDFPNKPLHADFIRQNIFPYFIEKYLLNHVWTKIYKRDMIVSNHISFPQGMALGEDAIFNMKAFNNCQSALYVDYAGYHYKEIDGSATHNIAGKDYFKKVLEDYHLDYRALMNIDMSEDELQKIKAIKLINNAYSIIHFYFGSKGLSLSGRFSRVRKILHNPELIAALKKYAGEMMSNKSAYSRFVLKSIQTKSIYKIYFATLYSHYRNA